MMISDSQVIIIDGKLLRDVIRATKEVLLAKSGHGARRQQG
jgi:hypothetical protein